jgi:mono/diheme cytochrome c family protein
VIERYLSPEEWRRLLRGLTAVIGVIMVFGLFALIVVPGLRNANQPPSRSPVEPAAGSAGWLDPTDYPPMRGYDIPPLDPKTVMDPTPELLAQGKALFSQYCVPCHGEDGRGDGPSAGALRPSPRNFTEPKGWTNGPTRPDVWKTLASGVPGTGMVAYDILTKKERIALVHYVRSFAKFGAPAEDPAKLAELAKELAAPGERVPNRIPVSAAQAHLIAEYHASAEVRVGPDSPEILRRAVSDGGRVARVLAQSPDWQRSPQALARVALADLSADGFRPETAAFTDAEWGALADALRATLAPAEAPPHLPSKGARQ